jgi:hypothetical protein
MSIIQLKHDSRLEYPKKKNLPTLPEDVLNIAGEAVVITFRDACRIKPAVIYKKLTAGSRFLDFPKGNLVFYGIENDSPLASLILWDAAHRLTIGASITLWEDVEQHSYLEKAYFKNSFSIEQRDHQKLVLRKNALLLAEQDAGLSRWSFCIPTGPGDVTGLNVVVKRILELDIPEKEILLCGRPDKSFQYWDKVRIVGEYIPAPPIWITRKKNVLAQEARFENLCILHDRVFLPLNFMQAIRNFGDYFPFSAFQSLWFDDLLNVCPVRYSDFGCAVDDHIADAVLADKGNKTSLFTASLFPEIEKQNFKFGNSLRNQRGSYLTGSLYIVKRQVWQHVPQDEELYWAEFEDIEQAKRCETYGIPHRIIPGAFTQSLFARPILYTAGYSSYFSANGMTKLTRKIIPLPTRWLKPMIKLSEVDANKRLARFSAKYCSGGFSRFASESNALSKMIAIIYSAQLPLQKSAIYQFIDDVECDILCDQLGYAEKRWLSEQFIRHHSDAKINFGRHFKEIIFQFALRPHGRRFYQNILDYFPERSWKVKLGSMLSAWRLITMNGDFLYHPDGWRGYYKAIMDSTPFIDYAEANHDSSCY